jgi:hypothetical protein
MKRDLTKKEQNTLVKIFRECSPTLIRDTLIDGNVTDESFPRFYEEMDGKIKASKGYFMSRGEITFREDNSRYYLSKENYEKKYKDAMERAKMILCCLGYGDKSISDIETIFPELAESEDDKINRAIFKALSKKDAREVLLEEGIEVSDALSYLKKQKTESPELYYDKKLENAAKEFYLSGGADSPFDSTGLLSIVKMAEFGAEWQKKKTEKEQNSVKENKEETIIEELINYFKTELELIEDSENYQLIGDTKRWLSYLESKKEQKPTDLPAGFYFIDQDGNKYYSKEFRYNNGTFTTTMKVEKEQKSEWSEADETKLRDVVHIVEDSGYIRPIKEHYKEFLTSLPERFNLQPKQERNDDSPNFKPSKVQMRCLEYAIDSYETCDARRFELQKLHDELEKLM